MTQNQINLVQKLVKDAGLKQSENQLAEKFSHGRVSTYAAMNYKETQLLIRSFIKPNKADKMRKKILSMAHEMGWELLDGRVDFERLNNWCVKHTPSHKPFEDIPNKDLPLTVTIMSKVYKTFLKRF